MATSYTERSVPSATDYGGGIGGGFLLNEDGSFIVLEGVGYSLLLLEQSGGVTSYTERTPPSATSYTLRTSP